MGVNDIEIVDDIRDTGKWMNMRNKRFVDYTHKSLFLENLNARTDIETIIHMGAQSSTTERNFDYLWNNNFEYTKSLWKYCAKKNIPFIYASSAATYGGGERGFDDRMDIDLLRPLNGYGYSKQLFDQWVKHYAQESPQQYVGLKFFNVYGPNEYFKGSMASMVFHGYKQLRADGEIRLFKSYNPNYPDGGQLRDFIYVKDICDVLVWMLEHKNVSGLFNVGTGHAASFEELARSTFAALDMEPNIHYIDMPEQLREKYQYYTQADISKLRSVGYVRPFFALREGVEDYVQNYLDRGFEIY